MLDLFRLRPTKSTKDKLQNVRYYLSRVCFLQHEQQKPSFEDSNSFVATERINKPISERITYETVSSSLLLVIVL